jgi:hypothetical protein
MISTGSALIIHIGAADYVITDSIWIRRDQFDQLGLAGYSVLAGVLIWEL